MTPSKKAAPSPAEESRWKAYRAANRLIVGAGILLAESGVPCQAPELKALSAALRALNRAGALFGPKSLPSAQGEGMAASSRPLAPRFRRAAP